MTPAETDFKLQDAFFRALQDGQKFHDPSSYVGGEYGTPTDVMNAISVMVKKGFLVAWYFGMCELGHIKYSGPDEQGAEDALGTPCSNAPICERPAYVRCVYGIHLPEEEEQKP